MRRVVYEEKLPSDEPRVLVPAVPGYRIVVRGCVFEADVPCGWRLFSRRQDMDLQPLTPRVGMVLSAGGFGPADVVCATFPGEELIVMRDSPSVVTGMFAYDLELAVDNHRLTYFE